MSWYVTHSVGGRIGRRTLRELFKAAADLDLLMVASDEPARTILEADRLIGDPIDLLKPDGTLGFYAPDFRSDSIKTLEDLCIANGLPYVSVVDADEEAGGSTKWWSPGMAKESRCASDHDGEPVFTLSQIAEAHAEASIGTLIASCTVPILPKLEVTD